ncbi:MAG: DNA replication and repair protein RecF [Armatimonadota bacterium]|nr:DNA replication and repair protein RecF [Armatimonadota bacterium]
MAYLRRLWLRDFRNYTHGDVHLAGGLTVFVGGNGEGKSNLLEAVYLTATGRSYRTAREWEVIRRGSNVCRVRAWVARRGRDEELEITVSREAERTNIRMRVNGVEMSRGAVLGRLPVVIAGPWDLDLVRGASGVRRRLLDGALSQLSPAYFFALHRYHRVVVQRNAELRRRRADGLEPWDAQLVALGVRITARRADYVGRIAPHAAVWFAQFGGTGNLEVVYRPSWQGLSDEERTACAWAKLGRTRADEYQRGVTLSGPHRDEMEFLLDGVPLRVHGSQGQWRTAMLAVRLAERAVMAAEMGIRPVLLLDDALAELDPERQRRFLELQNEGQTLVTATTLPPLARSVQAFRVQAGTLLEGEWSLPSATF